MSDETKRDVFDEVRYKFRNFKNKHRHGMYVSPDSIDHYLGDALKRYAAALPDDLPTLPRIIGEYLKDSKLAHNGISFLFQVGNHAMSDYRIAFENWAFTGKSFDEYEKGDTFARAWVLGVWRVEETGEIVKLEAEK
jgi:hypothetical protein